MTIKRHFSALLVWPQLLEKFLVLASLLRSDSGSVYWRGQNHSQGICASASTAKCFCVALVFLGALLEGVAWEGQRVPNPLHLASSWSLVWQCSQGHLSGQPVLASPVAVDRQSREASLH